MFAFFMIFVEDFDYFDCDNGEEDSISSMNLINW